MQRHQEPEILAGLGEHTGARQAPLLAFTVVPLEPLGG